MKIEAYQVVFRENFSLDINYKFLKRNHDSEISRQSADVKPKKKKSFTLLEIVFTIVIIGILLAIFLPVMSAVKLAAQKVKDQSNLKTIAEAWKEYTINRGILMDIEGEGSDYGIWFAFSWGGRGGVLSKASFIALIVS
jgi:competence protein ComGC